MPGCCAREQCAPAASLPSPSGQDPRLGHGLGPGLLTDEREELSVTIGSPPQRPGSGELRVGVHSLLAFCFCDGHTCPDITIAAGATISSNGRHQCSVHNELGASEEQAVCDGSRAAESLCTSQEGPGREQTH